MAKSFERTPLEASSDAWDDLAGAIADAAQLPSEAQAAMAGWLDAARLRQGAEAGIDTLSADLPATN